MSFPVAGLFVPRERGVRVELDWSERWFGEKSSFVYNHGLARISALLSQLSYSDVEENLYGSALVEAYEALGVRTADVDVFYDTDADDEEFSMDQCAFSIACKEIDSSIGKRTLVFVVLRGTVMDFREWMSNLNVSGDADRFSVYHEGFRKCASKVEVELSAFLGRRGIDGKEAFFLVTGHSRGAAVANLLGARLCDSGLFDAARLHVYTFATPNVTTSGKTDRLKYGFIFNVLNDEDIVPLIPLSKNWGFRRFGRNLVTVSLWNSRGSEFEADFIPRVNGYYEMFMGRAYATSGTGSFLPGLAADILADRFKDARAYNREGTGFKAISERMLRRVMPPGKRLSAEDVAQSADKLKAGSLGRRIDKVMSQMLDAHISESYLAWLLALDERELYRDVGSVRVTLRGNFDLAVFGEDGSVVAKVMNGYVRLKDRAVPVGALSLPGSTVLGFPANRDFTVAVYKDTLLPTPVRLKVERLDVRANVISQSELDPERTGETDFALFPKVGVVYVFDAGKNSFTERSLRLSVASGKDGSKLVGAGKLDQFRYFRFQPEVNVGTDFSGAAAFELGFHAGTRLLYGSVLFSFPDGGFQLSPGLGHEQPVFDRIMLNAEVFGRLRWPDGAEFRFLPGARLSLSYKPIHYFQVFVAYDVSFDAKDREFGHQLKCGVKF